MLVSEIKILVKEYGLSSSSTIDEIVVALLEFWLVSLDIVDKKWLSSAVSKVAGYLSKF